VTKVGPGSVSPAIVPADPPVVEEELLVAEAPEPLDAEPEIPEPPLEPPDPEPETDPAPDPGPAPELPPAFPPELPPEPEAEVEPETPPLSGDAAQAATVAATRTSETRRGGIWADYLK